MKPGMGSVSTDGERIERIAAQQFFKRDSGVWTDADQAQLDEWLNSSIAHRVAFLRLNAGWKRAARMKALGAGVPAGTIPPPGSWGDIRFPGGQAGNQAPEEPETLARASSPNAGALKLIKIAAVVLVTLGIGLYAYDTGIFQANRYSTPVGGLDTVPLADGSHVTLNTDTRIRVELSEKERHVDLDKGEAFFEVAKDSARPFVVQAGNKRITAVGTQFSVRRNGDDIRVSVTEGKVRIDGPGILSSSFLQAGSVAQTADEETLTRESSPHEVEQTLSWRSGYLVFEATPLADAVAEFNRYNSRKIVIDDAQIAALRIGGNFRANNTDAFLWLLESGFSIGIEHSNDRIVLTKK